MGDKKRITNSSVQDPRALAALLRAFDVEVDDLRTLTNQVRTLLTTIRDALVGGDVTVSLPGLSTGSTNTGVASLAFMFNIDGDQYEKPAAATGTALSGTNVPGNTFGCFRLEIGADLTIDIAEAIDHTNGYGNVALAIAALPAVAANHANLGIVTVMNNAGLFEPGTTELDHANVLEVYTDAVGIFDAIGSALAASAVVEQVEHGD